MAITVYDAGTVAGGALGVEIQSGDPSIFLPDLAKVDILTGITIFRKMYLVNSEVSEVTVQVAYQKCGEFDMMVLFPSSGDAQVVGDLTGAETKYGGVVITKAIDTALSEETVNGAGGLIDIKKIIVPKISTYVLFRVGEVILIKGEYATVGSIVDQVTAWEITLVSEIPYMQVIGEYASSQIPLAVAGSGHESFWVEQYIEAGSVTTENFNSLKLLLDY